MQSVAWIRSCLTDRSQQVVVDGKKSASDPGYLKVPQSPILRPILLLEFINDMPECIQSKCHLLADGSIIYRPVASEENCQSLQRELEAVEEWEQEWGMSFNPSKGIVMQVTKNKPILHTYMLKGEPLGVVETATYLGVSNSKDLGW